MSNYKEIKTRQQFDSIPFHVADQSGEDLLFFQIPPLTDFIDKISKDELVLDIGCGTGRTTLYMLNKGLQVVGLEISYKSLELIKGEFPAQLVQATNIELPLGTGTVDVAISDGVIPYTDDPYKALSETLRSLKSGGRALVAVYKRNHFYYYAYTYAGGLMRFINNYSIGAKLLTSMALPAYHFARNILRRKRKSSLDKSKALFYSYFMSPKISFFTKTQIMEWVNALGAECTDYEPCDGWSAHVFIINKA